MGISHQQLGVSIAMERPADVDRGKAKAIAVADVPCNKEAVLVLNISMFLNDFGTVG